MSIQANINQMLSSLQWGVGFAARIGREPAEKAVQQSKESIATAAKEREALINKAQGAGVNTKASPVTPGEAPEPGTIIGNIKATKFAESELKRAEAEKMATSNFSKGINAAITRKTNKEMAEKARKSAFDEMYAKIDTAAKAADWLAMIKKGVNEG